MEKIDEHCLYWKSVKTISFIITISIYIHLYIAFISCDQKSLKWTTKEKKDFVPYCQVILFKSSCLCDGFVKVLKEKKGKEKTKSILPFLNQGS